MDRAEKPMLVVGIGDIHGRFRRVDGWISALEEARGREATLVLAVGDVEAFLHADDHRRKAAKRTLPAEFADYVSAGTSLRRPLHFIGGNNEDFESLHGIQEGGALAAGLHYLGRAGVTTLAGLRIAFLSGIHAPRHLDGPLEAPRTKDTAKQAGYFRRPELERLEVARGIDLMLIHEWPKGLVRKVPGLTLRAHRFPWIGNAPVRKLVEAIRPAWLWTGHSHVPLAAAISHPEGEVTRVACLDQAADPEGGVFWLEYEGGAAVRGGWGITGAVAWERGGPWDLPQTPGEELQ